MERTTLLIVIGLLGFRPGSGSLDAQDTSAVTDPRDGRTYPTTTLGDQTWLGANLDYDAGSGSRCLADLPANCDRYGRLYTWRAARTAGPAGWRLPTEADWQDLERFLGVPEDQFDAIRYRGGATKDGDFGMVAIAV